MATQGTSLISWWRQKCKNPNQPHKQYSGLCSLHICDHLTSPRQKLKGRGNRLHSLRFWQGLLWSSKELQPAIPPTRYGVRKEEDLREGNNEKAEDLTVIIVTLAADWFHKEEPACKLPNRNSLDYQLHEGRTHLYSQCLAPCFLCHGHKIIFVERMDSIRSVV